MIRVLCCLCTAIALWSAEPATVDLRLKDRPLVEALIQVADQARATLLVDAGLIERIEAHVVVDAQRLPWTDLVSWLRTDHRLSLRLEGALLRVGDAIAEDRSRLEIRSYDLRGLESGVSSFPGPDLDIPEPGGSGSRLLPPVADGAPPELDDFIDLIQRQVTPAAWGGDSGVAMAEYRGLLLVTHTPEGHQAIEEFLRGQERKARRQILCRVHRLPAQPDINAVLDAAGTKALLAGSQPVAAILCRDGQQNHHFSGRQHVLVADLNVVQSAMDPITSVISDGLVVDIAPFLTVGGVLATVRFTERQRDDEPRETLVSDGAGRLEAAIGLPSGMQAYARDTRLVPPNGCALYPAGDHCYALEFLVVE